LDWEAEEIVPLGSARLTYPPAVEEAGRQHMEGASSPRLLIELVQDICTVPEIGRVIARSCVLRYQAHQIGRCEEGAWLGHGKECIVDHVLLPEISPICSEERCEVLNQDNIGVHPETSMVVEDDNPLQV
jgi:hypothetical protein